MKVRLLFMTLLGTMLISCTKDDGTQDLGSGPYRIASINIVDSHGKVTKLYTYSYEGEKLVKESYYSKYDGEMLEMYRTEYTYSGNEITGLVSRAEDFQKADTKYVYKFENGIRTEYSRYTVDIAGAFDERERIIYNYMDGHLVSFTGYLKRDGNTLLEVSRRSFSYSNGKLTESLIEYNTLDVWKKSKYCFYYTNNKLEKRILSYYRDDSWNEAETIEYFYSGDNLTRATMKLKDISGDSLIYKYDHNYLVEVCPLSGKIVYEYEPGQGNFSAIYDKPGEFLIDYQGVR